MNRVRVLTNTHFFHNNPLSYTWSRYPQVLTPEVQHPPFWNDEVNGRRHGLSISYYKGIFTGSTTVIIHRSSIFMKKVLIYHLFVTKEILTYHHYATVECVIHIVSPLILYAREYVNVNWCNQRQLHLWNFYMNK